MTPTSGRNSPGKTILKVKGLRIEAASATGWNEIVHGIDLHLRAGEILGLIGESGAGKSTIGLAMMGFARDGCRISAGEVIFDEYDVLGMSEHDIKSLQGLRMTYVAQSAAAAFNPAHRLLRQCTEVLVKRRRQLRSRAIAAVQSLFARMQLPNPERIGSRYPHQVSGGQLQRAMAAMAMAPQPELIVFDEPTTALDVTTQVEVLAAIRSAVRDLGMAAIYISHDLAVVAQMADRIMVLRHGRLVEEGPTAEILSNASDPYTRALVGLRQFKKVHAAESGRSVLDIKGINAGYQGLQVLHDLSITADLGETVAIVGESGSGKSTLARVVAGLLVPQSGHVLVEGKVIPSHFRRRSSEQLRTIQLIHQMPDTALNPEHTVAKILGRPLTFFFGLRGAERAKRVRELMSMTELDADQLLDRRPGELSGGQKQRLCIARALAAQPTVVICDEVTSALDPLIADEILKLLDRLQRERNLTYLFITHDLATVRAIADKVIVMKAGRIVEQARKDEIFSTPREAYTELLLSSTPQMATTWMDELLTARAAGMQAAAPSNAVRQPLEVAPVR